MSHREQRNLIFQNIQAAAKQANLVVASAVADVALGETANQNEDCIVKAWEELGWDCNVALRTKDHLSLDALLVRVLLSSGVKVFLKVSILVFSFDSLRR